MSVFQEIFESVIASPDLQKNLDWGRARSGHPEGTVRAHIAEIEPNLDSLRSRLSDDEYWKLKAIVWTHDSFKADADKGVPISHPMSHASLARAFLSRFTGDADVLAIVQFHDEPYALWRQVESKGNYSADRFAALLRAIKDWNLFLAFNIVDGCTAGKRREPLQWLFREVHGKVTSRFSESDIL